MRAPKGRFRDLTARLRSALGWDFTYPIGRCSVVLPAGHKLPAYQRSHSQYDRFLPHLARALSAGSVVIDVGANCGDTVVSMLDQNPRVGFLCVEADATFFRYLQANVARLRQDGLDCQVTLVHGLAGAELSNVVMQGPRSTKRAVAAPDQAANTMNARPLDAILSAEGIPAERVAVVKVDTDGYDYDVIASASALLTARTPMLFFECQFTAHAQKARYDQMIGELGDRGYTDWAIFDNYGALLLRTREVAQVHQLVDYLWQQEAGRSTRTLYYLDLLASGERDRSLIEGVLTSYQVGPD